MRLIIKLAFQIGNDTISGMEALFYIFHPVKAIEAKMRQIGVSVDMVAPPPGSNIEEFLTLSISQAAALISFARQSRIGKSGIQLEDWSKADQVRMSKGEKPRGTPIHRNL